MKSKIKKLIQSKKIKGELIEHQESDGLTSQQAAKANKVSLNQIVKTLLFIGKNKEKAIVIIQGNKRVDIKKIPKLKKPRLANKKELKELLGTEPGGIPPIGLPETIVKLIDKGLEKKELVIGSGGDRFTGLKTSPREIIKQEKTKVLDLQEKGERDKMKTMDIDKKVNLITRNTVEVLTDKDLKNLIKSGTPLKHYIGFEISGMVHLGTGLISMGKIADFLKAGVECTVFLADWHTFINEKLDGQWSTIKKAANDYFKEALIASLKCFDADWEKVNFVLGSNLYQDSTHWQTLMEVSQNTTLSRVQRSLDIAGRQAGQGVDFAKLIYPPLQVADIFSLQANIAHAGMDQRKAHVIAREVADKLEISPLKNKKGEKIPPICIHQPMIAGLEKPSEWPVKELSREALIDIKMSKSNPRSCIFIHDSPEQIKQKIKEAFAPPKEIGYNPIIDWTERLIFWGQNRVEKGLEIKREEEHGGNVVYTDIDNLKQDYKQGKLHPLDLKNAVADWLIKKLEPAREHFKSSKPKQGLELIKNIK